jgi:hypothetical protein
MRRSWTPSIVPNGNDQTVYLMVNDFGPLGRAAGRNKTFFESLFE